ncbi:hypothetical protein V8G54_002825 [Vigna mungo]
MDKISSSSSSSSSPSPSYFKLPHHLHHVAEQMKHRRFAFQTRSQVDILDDGYRWRKYGEKSVKNNKFPRSYYRCSYRGCNVKKQIQRHSKDEEIVVTTYEGTHSHPVEKTSESFEQILRNHHIYSLTL